MEKKKEEIDVFDFNNTIAEFLRDGLLKYVEENKKVTFLPLPILNRKILMVHLMS